MDAAIPASSAERAARGISLVEVIIALAVLGVGLAGLLAVVPMSTRGLHDGAQVSAATFLAEQRLEQIASAPWSSTPSTDCVGISGTSPATWAFAAGVAPRATGTCRGADASYPDEGPDGDGAARLVAPFGRYTRRARVQPCDVAGAACGDVRDGALRLLVVRVGYVSRGEGGAETRWVELSTLIARR